MYVCHSDTIWVLNEIITYQSVTNDRYIISHLPSISVMREVALRFGPHISSKIKNAGTDVEVDILTPPVIKGYIPTRQLFVRYKVKTTHAVWVLIFAYTIYFTLI